MSNGSSPPLGGPVVGAGVKGAFDNPVAPVNVLSPPLPHAYLWLRFIDPDKQVRDFPEGLRVKVTHGTPPHTKHQIYVTNRSGDKRGLLTFPIKFPITEDAMWQNTHRVWDRFTLLWDVETYTDPPYVLCEKVGNVSRTCELAAEADVNELSPPSGSPPPAAGKRYFRLPAKWSLKATQWDVKPFPGLGSFEKERGAFRQSGSPPSIYHDIGTEDKPVECILDPNWRFVRFEFFDRRWGHESHGDKRISIPPVVLNGFRKADPVPADVPDARCRWEIMAAGSPPSNVVQTLPWIVRYTDTDDNPRAELPKLKGTGMLLRFDTRARTFVHSKSATERLLLQIPENDARLEPSVERLSYYDLPAVWKSKIYYTRLAAAGKFFGAVTEGDVDASADAANALGFCLDDIVLYEDSAGAIRPLSSWAPSDRLAVFNHRFNNTIGAGTRTHHGVYKHRAAAGAVNQFNLPQSDVVVTRTPDVPKDTYVYDYPDWTRLVVAQGNLFDVFDQRAPDNADNQRVVGARAAVRWVDASAAFPGVATEEWNWVHVPGTPGFPAGLAGWVLAPAPHTPVPGRKLQSAVRSGGRPTYVDKPAAKPLFALQPFHYQACTEFPRRYDTARTTWFGRFDMLLLRCCDITGDKEELATNLHYIRSFWAGSANNATGKNFNDAVCVNTSARWNGADAINTCRATMLPNESPPPKLKVQVVWFDQAVQLNKAHFQLAVGAGRSNRGSGDGTGEYNNPADMASQADGWHTSAHESGHMNGLPDDYNERWNCASYDQISYQSNGPPGDPYEPDGRLDASTPTPGGVYSGSMMNVNARVRGRYFWPSAEWVSRVIGSPLKISFQDVLDSAAYEYFLPPHPTERDNDRTYLSWPLIGIRNATRNAPFPASPPASPPSSPPGSPPAAWDRFEAYLYPLGKDHYSQHALGKLCADTIAARPPVSPPASSPPPGGRRFDGIFVINLRLKCTLPDRPNVATEDTIRTDLSAIIAAVVRKNLSYRWRCKGAFGSPPQTFENCLINFVPLILVANDPRGHYAGKGWDAVELDTHYGSHFELEIKYPVSLLPANWQQGSRKLVLACPSKPSVESQLEREFPKFFGFAKTMGSMNAADIAAIVNIIGGTNVVVTDV